MSRFHFHRRFKHHFGETPLGMIAVACFAKPFDPEALLATIAAAVGGGRGVAVKPESTGRLTLAMLSVRPGLLTGAGKFLLALGWLCILFFNAIWWGKMLGWPPFQ